MTKGEEKGESVTEILGELESCPEMLQGCPMRVIIHQSDFSSLSVSRPPSCSAPCLLCNVIIFFSRGVTFIKNAGVVAASVWDGFWGVFTVWDSQR